MPSATLDAGELLRRLKACGLTPETRFTRHSLRLDFGSGRRFDLRKGKGGGEELRRIAIHGAVIRDLLRYLEIPATSIEQHFPQFRD